MWECYNMGIIWGNPVAMGRPRMTRGGRAYTPIKSREYMNDAIEQIKRQWDGKPMLANQPLRLHLVFVHPRPKRIASNERTPKMTKPDLDNLIKMVMDSLTKSEIWIDDNIVTEINATDWYANAYERPHVMYSIYTKQPPF